MSIPKKFKIVPRNLTSFNGFYNYLHHFQNPFFTLSVSNLKGASVCVCVCVCVCNAQISGIEDLVHTTCSSLTILQIFAFYLHIYNNFIGIYVGRLLYTNCICRNRTLGGCSVFIHQRVGGKNDVQG